MLLAFSLAAAVCVATTVSPVAANDPQTRPATQPAGHPDVGAPISGSVLLADGKPAAGATVILLVPQHAIWLANGRFDREIHWRTEKPRPDVTTRTAADGRFAFEPELTGRALVVVHPDGYAEALASQTAPITLQPWGRVHGTIGKARPPGKPAAVVLKAARPVGGASLDDPQEIIHEYTAIADEQGRFMFERVAPGPYWVHRAWSWPVEGGDPTISVQPGQTAPIALYSVVTGRLVPGEGLVFAPRTVHVSVTAKTRYPAWSGTSDQLQQVAARYEEYLRSDEFKVYKRENIALAADGSFLLEDLPVAEYTLAVEVRERVRGQPAPGRVIGRLAHEFQAPAAFGTKEAKLYNLGLLTVERVRRDAPEARRASDSRPADVATRPVGVRPQEPSIAHPASLSATTSEVAASLPASITRALKTDVVSTGPAVTTQAASRPAEIDWEEAAEGLSCRLRPQRVQWPATEIPEFQLDIRNRGAQTRGITLHQSGCELQVDGRMYAWAGPQVALPTYLLLPGARRDAAVLVTLTPEWRTTAGVHSREPGGDPLRLPPGRHSMRLLALFAEIPNGGAPASRPNNAAIPVLSNPVEILIQPGADETPAPGPREERIVTSAPAGGPRQIRFPNDDRLGSAQLFLVDARGSRPVGPARGMITVPAGAGLELFISAATPGQACDLSPLASLRPNDLQTLVLRVPQLTDADLGRVRGLTGLQNLEIFHETGALTDAGLRHLANLRELKTFRLFAGSPAGVATLTDDSLTFLERCPALQIVELQIATNDEVLARLTAGERVRHALRFLDVRAGPASAASLSDAGLVHLARLTSLRGLQVSGERITDATLTRLRGLRGLEELTVSGTNITDAGLASIAQLASLKRLALAGTQVTDAGLALIKDLGRLEWLSLPDQISDQGLATVERMKSLRVLRLSGERMSDAGLAHLSGLAALRYLTLPPGATDQGLAHIAGLPRLSRLDLAGTKVTDAGLANVARLPTLQELNLPPAATDKGLAALKACRTLRLLSCEEAATTDTGIKALQAALPNLRITPPRGASSPHLQASGPVTLAGGITVEIVGVTRRNLPGELWWRASGVPLDKPPYASGGYPSEAAGYEVAVRVTGTNDFDLVAIGGIQGRSMAPSSIPKDARRQLLPDLRALLLPELAEHENTASVEIGLAAGAWAQVETWSLSWEGIDPAASITGRNGLVLSPPKAEGDAVLAELTHTYTRDSTRLIALDAAGTVHAPARQTHGGTGAGLQKCTYWFAGMRLGDLRSLTFQKRPYEQWVTFSGVSLEPGLRTNVQVTRASAPEAAAQKLPLSPLLLPHTD